MTDKYEWVSISERQPLPHKPVTVFYAYQCERNGLRKAAADGQYIKGRFHFNDNTQQNPDDYLVISWKYSDAGA